MSAIDFRWIIRRFLATLPWLLMAVVSLIWTCCAVDFFVRWGYRMFTGVMVI